MLIHETNLCMESNAFMAYWVHKNERIQLFFNFNIIIIISLWQNGNYSAFKVLHSVLNYSCFRSVIRKWKPQFKKKNNNHNWTKGGKLKLFGLSQSHSPKLYLYHVQIKFFLLGSLDWSICSGFLKVIIPLWLTIVL